GGRHAKRVAVGHLPAHQRHAERRLDLAAADSAGRAAVPVLRACPHLMARPERLCAGGGACADRAWLGLRRVRGREHP
ncbi:MAG: hypothetical protein ACK56I_35890, partial [bacterium]